MGEGLDKGSVTESGEKETTINIILFIHATKRSLIMTHSQQRANSQSFFLSGLLRFRAGVC